MDRHVSDDSGEDESGDTKEADQSKRTQQSKQTKSENTSHGMCTENTLNRKNHDIAYRAEMNSRDSQEHSEDVEKCNGAPSSEKLLSSEAGVGEAGADGKGDDEEKAAHSSHPGIPVDRGWAWVIMMGKRTMTSRQ